MKIILFGTGDYYNKYKKWFKAEDIVALIDNNPKRIGTYLDGVLVWAPQEAILNVEFDFIIILSVHEVEMREQLTNLGVPNSKIIGYSDLIMHTELCCGSKDISFYGMDKVLGDLLSGNAHKYILSMSVNLDLNGATLALYYATQILIKNGYNVIFVSWNDGELKNYLLKKKIPLIIDPNFEIKCAEDILWIKPFNKMICNTLNYYQFLSKHSTKDKIIWWLHDPEIFYKSINIKLLEKIDLENVKICAVGPISEAAIRKYRIDANVEQLVYGIPDCNTKKITNNKDILEFVIIGNIQEYKGHDILINAIKMLTCDERKKIHLRIVGQQESKYAEQLKKEAVELGNTVQFVEPVSRDEIHAILEKTDVLICPSRVDTMSIVCNEAMQHSIPCIVSDNVGVAAYIIDNVNGMIFKQDDISDLSNKIRWCIDNKERLPQLGIASRKVYEDFFSMEVFETRLLKIIEDYFGKSLKNQ